jgi:hypothetical protein
MLSQGQQNNMLHLIMNGIYQLNLIKAKNITLKLLKEF